MLAPEARRRELKLATAGLVQAVGGFEAAASLVPPGKSQIHRCASVNDRTSFLNVCDVAELEQRSARPHVTMTLAKLAGGVFIPLPEAFDDCHGLARKVLELAQELGEVSARVGEALGDGVVLPPEAAAIERELDDLIEKAAHTRAAVRAMQLTVEHHQTGPPS